MKPAYLIWDGLLLAIAAKRRLFYSMLANSLLTGVTGDSVRTDDGFRKGALFQWLRHLVTTPSWQKAMGSSDDLRTTIMECCLTNPGSWSKTLARAVLDDSDKDFRDQWHPFFETSFLDVLEPYDEAPPPPSLKGNNLNKAVDHKANTRSMDASTIPHKNQPAPSETTEKKTSIVKARSGWRLWEGGWVPKPIGFPHPHQEEVV